MRRLAVLILSGMLALPALASAQSPSPAGSPGPMLGVDTMDVCLSITGPVVQLTAEVLTQGIIDGTFTIEGLSTGCGTDVEPGTSPMPSPFLPSPVASPTS